MASATPEQAFELGRLVVSGRVNWKSVDRDRLQTEVIGNPDQFASEFTKFLQNGGKMQMIVLPGNFPTWRTIKLGTGLRSADNFREAIKQAGMKISGWGDDILGKPAFMASISSTEVEADLVNVSVGELGFKDGATYRDICARAKELGLIPCPAEVGPQLRLQYADQPKGEWLLVAMEAITDSRGRLSVFVVGHDDDGRWLYGLSGRADRFWRGCCRFPFLRRK